MSQKINKTKKKTKQITLTTAVSPLSLSLSVTFSMTADRLLAASTSNRRVRAAPLNHDGNSFNSLTVCLII